MPGHSGPGVTGSPGRKYCCSSSDSSNGDSASGDRGLQAARVRASQQVEVLDAASLFPPNPLLRPQRRVASPGSQRLAGMNNWAEQRYPMTWDPTWRGGGDRAGRGRSWELVESDSNGTSREASMSFEMPLVPPTWKLHWGMLTPPRGSQEPSEFWPHSQQSESWLLLLLSL